MTLPRHAFYGMLEGRYSQVLTEPPPTALEPVPAGLDLAAQALLRGEVVPLRHRLPFLPTWPTPLIMPAPPLQP